MTRKAVKIARKPRQARVDERQRVEPPPDVVAYWSGENEPLDDIDVDGHLRWLRTGKGEPWPPARRS